LKVVKEIYLQNKAYICSQSKNFSCQSRLLQQYSSYFYKSSSPSVLWNQVLKMDYPFIKSTCPSWMLLYE